MDFRLYVGGRCEDKKINKKIGFKITDKTIALFLRYSPMDIWVGEKFTKIFDHDLPLQKQFLFDFDLTLIKSNPNIGKSIDFIPHGWKTISLFEGSVEDIKKLKKLIPINDDWGGDKKIFDITN